MLFNYILIAWRQILKNKLYAGINILGLVVGLVVYVFGSVLVDYERSHDTFFEHHERIFTAGSVFSSSAQIGVGETNGIYTALGPLIEAEVEEIEAMARTVRREFLMSVEQDHYYQKIRFADPALLDIFDFTYLEGDARALDDPAGLLLSRATARRLFGDVPALGREVRLNHDHSLYVTAVIEDLPRATHFTSSIAGDTEVEAVAPLMALNRIADYDLAGNFNNLSSADYTYMLLPPGRDRDWLQTQVDGVYDRHFPEDGKEFIVGSRVRPLVEANTNMWAAIGMPVLESVSVLAVLVLIVAIVNYTNLATAQSLGRAHEVGLRKTLGATRGQLLTQFLVESLTITGIAMLIALAMLELVVPLFNNLLAKDLAISYDQTLPWLLCTTVVVGLVAGAYPAWVITRATPIQALREGGRSGHKSSLFRSVMLGLQFAISIFMLAMVMIVFLQNKKVESASNIYPRSQILTLKSMEKGNILDRRDTLRNELLRLPGVENVSYSSLVPFEQSNAQTGVGAVNGDRDSMFLISRIVFDEAFLDTYDIRLLAGRNLTEANSADTIREGVLAANVMVNELALRQLGLGSPQEALGKVFFDFPDTREPRVYTVVGVLPDQNFQGFHNKIKPTMFSMDPEAYWYASLRVKGVGLGATLEQVEEVWDEVISDYPIQTEFLDDLFADTFSFYQSTGAVLGGFAAVAMSLSMIGLFGLAAFMAQSRTREIGIRKVMGASAPQIVRLMVWQFSRPVMWALLVALPGAWYASGIYLEFFADRLSFPAVIVMVAGTLAVLFAWAVVAFHALRVASASPVSALRYE